MRIVPFREVLHAVAFKLGLDPEQSNFLTNQAIPIGTYIDQWVARVWDAKDWPELVQTTEFVPNPSHIVPWNGAVNAFTNASLVNLNRVLKVFLVDPGTTDAPVDTHFTLGSAGVHVGYEHGTSVWIRYMPEAPRFTAVTWRPEVTFARDDITYSPLTGHVYKSKVNGNRGHDPGVTFSLPPPNPPTPPPPQPATQLPTEVTSELSSFQPGLATQNKIMEISLVTSAMTIPNPPPVDTEFFVNVDDDTGAHIAGYARINNGTDTLDIALADIANSLVAQLPPFTITTDIPSLTIRLSDASNFGLPNEVYITPAPGVVAFKLKVVQIQPFIDAIAPDYSETNQVITFPLNPDQVVPGATYQLDFRDVSGASHVVEYEATQSDTAQQILSGLINAIGNAQGIDTFFEDIASTLNNDEPSADFATSTEIGLNAQMTLPGSPFWEVVLFPEVLANQVERGAFADLYKEWGQEDKGMAEEGVVPTEIQGSEGTFTTTPNPPLTGQQRSMSRYKINGSQT